MQFKLQNILDEVDPIDKFDKNYINFLTHLVELAKENELLTFDPLKDNPKLFLEKTLLKKFSLKDPGAVFQINNLAHAMINTYIDEIGKRIKYHMEM
jgi:hypothetical protein